MFGGSHGHSHDGGDHGHSHGGGNHGHSHGGGGSKPNVGFGDDDDENGQSGLKSAQQKQAMMMQQNMMMMKMMASKMKNEGGGGGGGGGGDMTNAMMAMNPQMTPQMMEFAKKMFEERQKLMKEYMEQGGQSNPAALQEMMAKAALQQSQALAKLKEAQQSSTETSDMSIGQDLTKSIPSTGDGMMSIPSTGTSLIGVDSSYPKSSPLDELIKKKNDMKKAKDEEEARILDQIAKKEYSQLDAVKATQYGVLERLKELIESNQCDPNKPDSENVYLLHWAAINNRLEIAKYLISLGVKVDVIGGELESTPLNWAARSGHVHMVILLMQNGADPRLFDIEGFSTIHLAVMFAHSNVAAYLLVQGIDPDMMDQNGVSPLMYAAQRVHNRDPAQLLITFNARLNAQDSKGNTPLHYCVAFNNASVMHVLLDKGASLDIVNKKGQTALEFAIERKKIQAANLMRPYSDHDKENLPKFLLPLAKNKDIRKIFTQFYPFLILFYLGFIFNMDASWLFKLAFIALFYPVTYAFQRFRRRYCHLTHKKVGKLTKLASEARKKAGLFFDKNVTKYTPMATTLAFISWLYFTWFIYFRPFVFDFSWFSLLFITATTMSWYNFYKSYKADPGVLRTNRDQMNKTILQFVEQNEFSIESFCTACIIRKPLRSKHCSDCDRCVAKFDHHCPWVDNCIGENNLKYFVGFLFWTPICLAFFMHGALTHYNETCYLNDLSLFKQMSAVRLCYQFMMCSPWVSFFTIVAGTILFWMGALFIAHFYQAVFAALTTNERMNMHKYKHFYDKNGKYVNPFNFGFVQNFIDLIDTRVLCLKPTMVNWKKEHDIQDVLNSRLDKKKEKGSFDV